MATRSAIGIKRDDGTIKAIYCHFDGYPSNNGRILKNHYKDPDKINELIDMGDISSLEEDPDFKKTYISRGELDCTCGIFENLEDFFNHYGVDYYYIFENGNWSIFDDGGSPC